MCSRPSTPPRSMKAPKSVMFFTTPFRTWPTDNSFIRTSRLVLRSASSSTRRDTTMLRRRLFSLMILNSKLWPSSSSMFGTRRKAIWLPGRNASTPIRSTTTPPLIFLTSVPVTPASFSCASRIFSQTRMKSAFFFERTTAPSWSSRCSRKTSISSPSLRLLGSLNSSIETAPSDLNPTSRMTAVADTQNGVSGLLGGAVLFGIFDVVRFYQHSGHRFGCGFEVVDKPGNLPGEPAPRQFHHLANLLLQSQGRGIEQDGIGGRLQRGDGPGGIGRVARGQRLALAPDLIVAG